MTREMETWLSDSRVVTVVWLSTEADLAGAEYHALFTADERNCPAISRPIYLTRLFVTHVSVTT